MTPRRYNPLPAAGLGYSVAAVKIGGLMVYFEDETQMIRTARAAAQRLVRYFESLDTQSERELVEYSEAAGGVVDSDPADDARLLLAALGG